MRRFWYVFALLAFQPCRGILPQEVLERMVAPPTPEIHRRFGSWEGFAEKAQQAVPFASLLVTMAQLYQLEEGQFPSSWKVVCSTGWLPVQCDLLVNPITKRNLLDQKSGEFGSMWLEKHESDAYFVWLFYPPSDLTEPKELRLKLEPWAFTTEERNAWRKADASLKGLFALREILAAVLDSVSPCATDIEWEELQQRFHVFRAIRNPYTGEQLEAALWTTKPVDRDRLRSLLESAKPGQILVTWRRLGARWVPTVEVISRDGRLLGDLLKALNR